MTIFIGADHRGFELKNKLIEYIQDKDIRVEDLGAYDYDKNDDHPDFAQKVAKAVLQNHRDFLGVVICGSGDGVAISANRFKGIYCGLGYNENQVKHVRERDHINVLSLPADYIDFEKAKQLVDIFVNTEPIKQEKYVRRLKKMDKDLETNKPPYIT